MKSLYFIVSYTSTRLLSVTCMCFCFFVCVLVLFCSEEESISCTHTYTCACAIVSESLQPPGLQSTRLLCLWDSPGKNMEVGCHALLQGSFLTPRLNSSLLHLLRWQTDSLPWPALISVIKMGKQNKAEKQTWLSRTIYYGSCLVPGPFRQRL